MRIAGVNERRIGSQGATVEWEIDLIGVFVDRLAASQPRCDSADISLVQQLAETLRQFEITIESCVNDRDPILPGNRQQYDRHAV